MYCADWFVFLTSCSSVHASLVREREREMKVLLLCIYVCYVTKESIKFYIDGKIKIRYIALHFL